MNPWFLERFHSVTGRDPRWRADCLRCGGKRSLSFGEGDSCYMLKCWCGCPAKEVLAIAELQFDDLRFESTSQRGCTFSGAEAPARAPAPNKEGREPEMRQLARDHALGRLGEIEPAELGSLSDDAHPIDRAIAADIALRLGLQEYAGEDRPLPYAVSEAVKAGLCDYDTQASRALKRLVDGGVILYVGDMPPLPGRRFGTRLYASPVPSRRVAAAISKEPREVAFQAAELARTPAVEPALELMLEEPVVAAEVAVDPYGLMVAAAGSAGDRQPLHASDPDGDRGAKASIGLSRSERIARGRR